MRLRLLLASCLFTATALAQTSATKDPNTARGFESGKLYNLHGLDSVGTFNGNLNVRIPMGTFSVRPGFSYSLSCN